MLNQAFGVTIEAGSQPLAYTEVSGVTDNSITTIVTFTSVGATTVRQPMLQGRLPCEVTLFKNTVAFAKLNATGSTGYNATFDMQLSLADGDVLDLKVEHFLVGQTGTFTGTFVGV